MLQSENKYMQVLYIINKKRLVNIPPHPPKMCRIRNILALVKPLAKCKRCLGREQRTRG